MLTIFTTARPFRGHFGMIQRNAMASWKRLTPSVQVMLIGNEEGYAEACEELSIEQVVEVRCNDRGLPLLDSLIEQAERHARHDLILMVAADTILFQDVLAAAEAAARRFERFCLVTGRRHLKVDAPIDFTDLRWAARVRGESSRTTLDDLLAGDFFLFTRGLWGEIPPFSIGRTTADNWLYARARENDGVLIDATPAVTTVHQEHDYSHHAEGANGVFFGEEARANREMVTSMSLMHRWDANWVMTRERGLQPAGRLRRKRLVLQYELLRSWRRLTSRG